MSDLIARLETATGPDRELDGLIGLEVFPDANLWSPEWWSGGPNEYLRWPDPRPGVAKYEQLPRYTASIDAALTLVPDGLNWTVDGFPDGPACASVYKPTDDGPCSGLCDGKTPAIAVCIAALKARGTSKEQARAVASQDCRITR